MAVRRLVVHAGGQPGHTVGVIARLCVDEHGFYVRAELDGDLRLVVLKVAGGLLALDVAVWTSRKGESSIRCAPQEVRVFQRPEMNRRCGPVKGEVSGHSGGCQDKAWRFRVFRPQDLEGIFDALRCHTHSLRKWPDRSHERYAHRFRSARTSIDGHIPADRTGRRVECG